MNLSIAKNISLRLLRTSVAKKLVQNMISQGSIFTGKWLFNFTLAKLLSPSLFGLFTLVQALGNFLMNLFSFGAVAHLIQGISESHLSAYQQLQKSINLTLRIIVLTAFVWLLLTVFNAEIEHLHYFAWSILIGAVISINNQLFAFFKGLGEFQKEAQAAVIFCVISILTIGSIWTFGISTNIHVKLGLFCVLQCILTIKGFLYLRKWLQEKTDGQFPNTLSFFKERIPFGLHEIQSAIYIHVILLILGFMVPKEDLGMFRSVQLFITPISLLPSVVSQVTLSRLSSLKSKPLLQIKLFRKFLLAVTLAGLFFFAIYASIGGVFVNYVYNYRFDISTVNYLILCFSGAFLLRFISSNYGVLITSAGKQSIRVLMTFLSIVVSVLTTYLLTKSMGVRGAGLAGVASYAVITIGYSMYCELILFKTLRKNASNDSGA